MGQRKYLSADQVRAIRATNLSYSRIRALFQISDMTIANIRARRSYADVPDLQRALPHVDELITLNKHGMSASEIGELYGVSKSTVLGRIQRRRRAKERGVANERLTRPAKPKAKKPAKPKPRPKPAPITYQPVDPARACNVCGQDYAREGEDMCNGCASKVQRVEGFGDGPLPHYEGKAKQAASQMGRKAAQTRWLQANSNAIRKRTQAA